MSFVFTGTQILYSNLGGQGPLYPTGVSSSLQGIRYVNVGSVFDSVAGTQNIDLVLTNRSRYVPHDPSLNILNGKFAQVNLACNQQVLLRVTIQPSCSTGTSCELCNDITGTAARTDCYTRGCSCFGSTVYLPSGCTGMIREMYRSQYGCAAMGTVLNLPRSAMVSMIAGIVLPSLLAIAARHCTGSARECTHVNSDLCSRY